MNRRSIRFLRLAPLALIAALIGVALYGRPRGPQPPVSPLVGKLAPAFVLPAYDPLHPGLASADLRMGTPTVVNLFASWCLPCRIEAPRLATLAREGAVVHGIAVRDTPEGLAAFFRNYGNPFRRIGLDRQGAATRQLQAQGLPETLVIDGRGIVRLHHLGEVRADDLPAIRRALREAR